MWTLEFWKATLERAIRGAAAAIMGSWIGGDVVMNAFTIDWETALGIGLAGATMSLLMSLTGNAFGPGDGPSFTGRETIG